MQLNIHIFVIRILNSCSFKYFNKLPISVLIFVYGWLNFALIIFYVEYLLTSVGEGEGGREGGIYYTNHGVEFSNTHCLKLQDPI